MTARPPVRGVVNLYKPKGVTSHYCVNAVRRALGTRAVGHMGTLDPQGEGVLLIGVGKCTRLFDYYLGKDKVYEAEFTFGYETDTLDGDGAVVRSGGTVPDAEQIAAALPALTGRVEQVPPLYSAKSVNGVRAYDLARRGQTFELEPKSVEIFSIELLSYAPPRLSVRVHCSAGTYIRSICRDLAYALDTLATMTAIRRTRCGPFTVDDSVTMEQLDKRKEAALTSAQTALSDTTRYDAPDAFYQKLLNGVKTDVGAPPGICVLYCRDELFGLAETVEGVTRVKTNLRF